jgi:hypothetical protein
MAPDKFRTSISIPPFPEKIDYKDQLLFLGSCFANNIGQKFSDNKFNALVNPLGVLYNPKSIGLSLELMLGSKSLWEEDLVKNHGLWHSFYHHGKFSDPNKEICFSNCSTAIQKGITQLEKTDWLIITFGTAWVYEHIEKRMVVSNCHKIPSSEFMRYLMTICDIAEYWSTLINQVRMLNPNMKFLFTVSPVRHLKDGFHENQISKSSLILAVRRILSENSGCFYFPSYEIMMDDLRDYRFYAEDLTHPSPVAENYIWENIVDSIISTQSQQLMQDIAKLVSASRHRPFNPETIEHQTFVEKQLQKLNALQTNNPQLDFSKENTIFTDQLIS